MGGNGVTQSGDARMTKKMYVVKRKESEMWIMYRELWAHEWTFEKVIKNKSTTTDY